MEVEGWRVVTLVVKAKVHSQDYSHCSLECIDHYYRNLRMRLHNSCWWWRRWLNDVSNRCCISRFILKRTELLNDLNNDSKMFLISILVSMCLAKNLLSIVLFRLAYWRHNRSWMLSSDTPVRAKVVKRVISWGVVKVMIVAKAFSTICGGWEVTSISGGSIALTWGSRWAWRLLNNSSDSSFLFYCLASTSFCISISWRFNLSCFLWSSVAIPWLGT